MKNKFYKVEEQLSNRQWACIAYFKKRKDANIYMTLHNTRILVKPVRVTECKFTDINDHL